MSYVNEYNRTDNYILQHPEETLGLVKGMMSMMGENAAGMVALNNTNKQKVHRYLAGDVKNTFPEESHFYARSLGGVFRLGKNVTGKSVLSCGPATKTVNILLEEFYSTHNDEERHIIATFELPVAIRTLLGMIDNDSIVETKDGTRDYVYNPVPDPYEIIFRSRYYPAAEFGILIPRDPKNIMIGVWTSEDEEHAVRYRKAVGMGNEDEKAFRKILKENADWVRGKWAEQYVALTPLGFNENYHKMSVNLDVLRDIYERLVCVLAGVGIAKDFEGAGALLKEKSLESIRVSGRLPAEIERSVLQSSEYKCEVDPKHELFLGSDGVPYLKTMPLIPITKQTTKKFGEKLSSKANAVVVCPMCFEKLKHAEWRIKERIIMKLYDQKAKELKEEDMDVSMLDLLTWQKDAQETKAGDNVGTVQRESKPRIGSQLMLYTNSVDAFNGEGANE